MRKILIIGFGFIGSHVAEYAKKRGYHVVVFDRRKDAKYMDDYNYILGDVRDRNAVAEAVGLVDGVINLSGILGTSETVDNPFPSAETNIMGALNFLEACRQHKKRGVQITVGNHFMNNTYAISKTTAERFALMYNKEHGTQIAVVRGLNAYGPGQKHKPVRKIIPNFILPALRQEPIKIYGSGNSIMDMIWVKDLAKILVEALVCPRTRYDKIYSAGSGNKTPVSWIAGLVAGIAGSTVPPEFVSMRAGEVEDSIVLGEPESLQELGIVRGDLMKLEEGLKITVDWYRENYPWQQD